jgi:sporulation protein YlmC with PRC-barrel domain
MDIPINATVNCSNGPCGRSTYVILKPTTEKITHLVVNNELYPATEFLIPIEHVVESTPESIQLDCTSVEVSKMPVFIQVEFIPSNLTGFSASHYMMWPYYAPEIDYIRVEKEHIPANELAIRRGANVEATDGHVGRVDEFLINPDTDHITYLVLREGHLWGQKDVTIPVGQIDHYKDNAVYLKLDKHAIEALPTIPVHRGSAK